MGDYNADTNPDMNMMRDVMRARGFIPTIKVQVEQWTFDGNQRVIKVNDGTGRIRFRVKVNLDDI